MCWQTMQSGNTAPDTRAVYVSTRASVTSPPIILDHWTVVPTRAAEKDLDNLKRLKDQAVNALLKLKHNPDLGEQKRGTLVEGKSLLSFLRCDAGPSAGGVMEPGICHSLLGLIRYFSPVACFP